MAENDLGFNPAAEPATEAIPDEQLNLKKRARRRLVGAIALALLAVIVLPMVMDQEPKPLTQDIQIRIPSQESTSVSALSRVTPSKPAAAPAAAPAPAPASSTPAATAEAPPGNKPATKTETRPETKTEAPKAGVPSVSIAPAKPGEAKIAEKPVEKPADKPAAKAPAQELEAARATELLNAEQWVVQLGAYQDMANVKVLQGKIKGLGLPSFTEKVDTPQGARVRVRSGPFDSREAAEKAHERLKKIGAGAPSGGVVAKK
ncbi:MAG: SPOR domain-containing protein [Betaproteobacteria bacterium]|nr:SPOR domain-containing protein [Betaproteobacteria bacterium]